MKYDFNTIVDRRNTGARKWTPIEKLEEKIVPFSVADMEFKTAPEIADDLAKYCKEHIFGYDGPTNAYIEEVIKWHGEMRGVEIEKDWIVSTPGVVSGIYFMILSQTAKNDGVILFRPSYPPFGHSIENAGRKIIDCPLKNNEGHYTVDFELFEKQAKENTNKMVIICNPHNPIGRVWTKDELQKIYKIAKDNDLFIISDEIWADITIRGFKTTSMIEIAKGYEKIAVATAASKTFNIAGLCTSNFFVPNKETRKKFVKEFYKTHIAINSLGYRGTYAAYKYGKDWMNEMLEVIEDNYNYAKKFIEENIEGAVVTPIEGTYVLWVDLRCLGKNKEELEKFLTEKVYLYCNEGYNFGKEGEGFERINIAVPKKVLVDALDRLVEAING